MKLLNFMMIILEAKKRAPEDQTEQEGTWLKILTPEQTLQRLPIALTQVKQAVIQRVY